MRKTQIHWLIVGLIMLAVFNFLFFWLDFEKSAISIWISYAFIHVAYIQLIIVPFVVPKTKSSHLFIESISAISAAYFLTEIVLGSVFVLLSLEFWKLVFLIQFIIFLVNAFLLYVNVVANKRTANTEIYRKQAQKMLRSSMNYLQQAMTIIEKEDIELIADVYDELKASPLIVYESIRGIEENIMVSCQSILENAQRKDFDEMRKQVAFALQMTKIRKSS